MTLVLKVKSLQQLGGRFRIMKIEEVPQNVIDKDINSKGGRTANKHSEIWEKVNQLEKGFGVSVTFATLKEASSVAGSLRARCYNKKLPYRVALIKPDNRIYIYLNGKGH